MGMDLSPHLFRSSFIFFFLEWQFSVYNSYTHFVRFTLKYFIFLHATINGIFKNAKNFSFWLVCCRYNSFCCSVTKLCLSLCNPMDCSMSDSPVLHYLLEFTQIHVHWISNHLILFCLLLLLPSIFPRIRVFSSELVLFIRWPKDWHCSSRPSNEYSGLISFRVDWFDLFAV